MTASRAFLSQPRSRRRACWLLVLLCFSCLIPLQRNLDRRGGSAGALGEVLFLPSGKVLGGAPANFAYMTNILGDQGIVASRVGEDELGREACRVMQERGLNTSYVQHDDQHRTGTAAVIIDSGGQPTFTIKASVSWDFLE